MSKFTCKTCRYNVDPMENEHEDWPCDHCQNFNLWAAPDVCQYCCGMGCHLCGKPEKSFEQVQREQKIVIDIDEDVEEKAFELFDGTSDASGPHKYQIGIPPQELTIVPEPCETYSLDPFDGQATPPDDLPGAIVLDAEPEINLFPNDTEDHQITVEGIKDSGTRTEFDTGAVRDGRTNKGRFDLLPIMALFRLAKHYERGCLKYGDRNWEKGIPISKYIDSALRHLLKAMCGFSEEHHLTSALWNIASVMETLDRIALGILPDSLDDMPLTYNHVDYDRWEEILDTLL